LQEIQDRSGWAGPVRHERTLKTVLVTSALPGEGKTLTVINLALTLSEDFGRRVLVIDADVRRPAIHDVLGLSNAVGLTDVLRPGMEHLPLQEVSSRLSVLTAGRAIFDPRNLASDRMRSLLRDAASSFDWVLLDAPAIDRAPDARLLAGVSRAVLFVIARGTTRFSAVERAMSEIGRGSIIGAVLNEVPGGRLVRRREVNRRRAHRARTRRGPRER
jgi:capsular exopolysaccharide synthesis family protein